MEQNSSNLQSYWKKFANFNSNSSTSSNNQQESKHTHSRTNASANDNEVNTCAGGLDENQAKKIREDLDRARDQSSLNFSTKSRCSVAWLLCQWQFNFLLLFEKCKILE